MRVSIIIVNFNGGQFVHECLAGIERQSFKYFEVIVVDNGSTDGSAAKIREQFPLVRLIELGANLGFAAACARGWKESKGEDIAVLNNDAVPDPDWLGQMVSCLDSDPGLGAIACRVINKKSGKFESGGIFAGRNGLVYLFKPGNENQRCEIFGACGVAGLYRGRMLKQTGFYPEDFFIYYEDADLAFRGQRAGWRAVYCPDSVAYHLGSETTTGMGIKHYFLPRNRLRVLARNGDWLMLLKNSPWVAFYEAASFWGGLFVNPKSTVKARLDFLRGLPSDLKARAKILGSTAPGFDLKQWLSRSYPGIIDLWSARK